MFSIMQLRKRIGKRCSEKIDNFIKELCDEYAEDFGQLPGENAGFDMIHYFEEAFCDYTKEIVPDVEDAFDPTDFSTICRLGGLCNLPPVHPGGERSDGDLRNLGGKEHGEP